MNKQELEIVRDFFQTFVRSFLDVQEQGTKKWGVNGIQGHILYVLKNNPEISLKELANILNFDNSFISRQVQQLVEHELVERIPDDKDRRYIKLFLTDKGEEKQQEIAQFMNSYISKIMENIHSQKKDQMIESLRLLTIGLNTYHFKN